MCVPSFLELPSEVLWQIVPLLSRHDLSTCVRVSKVWYDAFMDSLWHTVVLNDIQRFSSYRPTFDHIKSLYGPYFDKEGTATRSPFVQNIHRIHVIKVQYPSFLDLFWDQRPSSLLEVIPLKQLSITFEDFPRPPAHRYAFGFVACPHEPLAPKDVEALLQILARSTQLSTFSFIGGSFN